MDDVLQYSSCLRYDPTSYAPVPSVLIVNIYNTVALIEHTVHYLFAAIATEAESMALRVPLPPNAPPKKERQLLITTNAWLHTNSFYMC